MSDASPVSRTLLVLCVNQGISASFSLSCYHRLHTTRFWSIKGTQQYRCNRQYVQGSGKLVLKLSGFRVTALPHLHPFHGHGASSSRGRCLRTSATKTVKRRKAMEGGAGCSSGSRGASDTAYWTPAPPASPPSHWACSFHLLGARQ